MKKVIGFCASPRVGFNTESLLRKVLKGAESKGAETKFYDVKKMNIGTCVGCAACRRAGECSIKDDMTDMLEEIRSADAVVFASPIYMLQMNVYMKKFVERMWPLLRGDSTSTMKDGVKGLNLFTQGTEYISAFKTYFDHNESLLEHFKFNVEPTFIVGNTRAKGDFEKQEDAVKKAFEIGVRLV